MSEQQARSNEKKEAQENQTVLRNNMKKYSLHLLAFGN